MGDQPVAAGSAEIEVEVIYCASRSLVDSSLLRLPRGASVDDALMAAGLLQRHPEIQNDGRHVGIWGRAVSAMQTLCDGDRVEIYRPLQVEPKDARRLRQRRQSAKGARNGG